MKWRKVDVACSPTMKVWTCHWLVTTAPVLTPERPACALARPVGSVDTCHWPALICARVRPSAKVEQSKRNPRVVSRGRTTATMLRDPGIEPNDVLVAQRPSVEPVKRATVSTAPPGRTTFQTMGAPLSWVRLREEGSVPLEAELVQERMLCSVPWRARPPPWYHAYTAAGSGAAAWLANQPPARSATKIMETGRSMGGLRIMYYSSTI
ncbi:MAG: hypothetical protein U1F77_13930 [Kiritimatiellia bacterium]